MKNNIFTISVVAAGLLLASCDGSWTPPVVADGELDLSAIDVVNDDAHKLVKSEQSRAEGADIDLSGYMVDICPAGSATPTKSWTVASMPEVVTLNQGDYTINVKSHQVVDAEWERPYYEGSQAFAITAGKITRVATVTCKFASIKVTITIDDALKALLDDDATFTVKANESGTLVFGKNETRAGYFKATEGSTTMAVDFKGVIGNTYIEESFPFTDIEAGQHRDITFKSKSTPTPPQPSGEVGLGGIDIDFTYTDKDIDGNVTYEEGTIDAERPGKEDPKDPDPTDPEDPNDPVVTDPITFTSTTLDLEGVNDAKTHSGDAIVDIHADKGIEHLYVTIDSQSLTKAELQGIGLDNEFDLAEPGDLEEGLQGLGFKTGADVKGATDVQFDITTFVPLLANFTGNHNFTVKVVDRDGNTKELTLKFKA